MRNFGFGCMRLPMKGEEVDYTEFSQMERKNLTHRRIKRHEIQRTGAYRH